MTTKINRIVKLSPAQTWALGRIAAGVSATLAGVAEMSVGPATYRGLVRLGLIAEHYDCGHRMVRLTDAGRAAIARAA